MLARWQPSWLRYSPLSFTGLAMIAAAVGVIYQTGAVAALEDSPLARQGLDAAERLGVVVTVVVAVLVVLALGVLLSVARSLVTFGNLVLSRRRRRPVACCSCSTACSGCASTPTTCVACAAARSANPCWCGRSAVRASTP